MVKYIVRADFYPSGEISPLGITNEQGVTYFVHKICKKEVVGENEYRFKCIVKTKWIVPIEKKVLLTFKSSRWTCEELV